jgi:hypothetical protein
MASGKQEPVTGGCQCGSTRYEIVSPPVALYVCHCRECQKQSASAFGISVFFRREDFRLTKGTVKSWTRDTDSGRRLRCLYCPDCGSRLWHETEGEPDAIVSIKGGSLDHAVDLSSAIHVWTCRKLEGVIIPEGAKQFVTED